MPELQHGILPLYEKHEQVFDQWSIHGRMHICRCLIFAEFMGRYYYECSQVTPKMDYVRYAVAFHDAGREGNGFDIWESQSAKRCEEYLDARMRKDTASTIGGLITKDKGGHWSVEKRIVHDADVLDIMRPCCGHGGRAGFRDRALRFLGPRDDAAERNAEIREWLIDEAWEFISVTEISKEKLTNSADYMADALNILDDLGNTCTLLSRCLAG